MSEMEVFLGKVRGLAISLDDILTPEESSEVHHLIDHSELGEGLRTLAWFIVLGNKQVSADVVQAIRDLSRGLVDPDDLPPTLDKHVKTAT